VSQVIIQPAGSPEARVHYARTIEQPVPLENLARFLTAADISGQLAELA
jgi:hypothetical protein